MVCGNSIVRNKGSGVGIGIIGIGLRRIEGLGRIEGGEEWRIEGRGFVRYVFIRCAEHLFDNGSQ